MKSWGILQSGTPFGRYLKKQWDENTKKVGEAITIAGVDLDWFASLPPTIKEADIPAPTIIINAGNDAAINLGQGNIVKDAVVTGSAIESAGGGSTTVQDSVITKSRIQSSGGDSSRYGVRIHDSVITSSTIKNIQKSPVEPVKEPEQQSIQNLCLFAGLLQEPGAKFCRNCGAKISVVCSQCGSTLPSYDKILSSVRSENLLIFSSYLRVGSGMTNLFLEYIGIHIWSRKDPVGNSIFTSATDIAKEKCPGDGEFLRSDKSG